MNLPISKLLPVEPTGTAKLYSPAEVPELESSFTLNFGEYLPPSALLDVKEGSSPQAGGDTSEIAFEDSFDGDDAPQFPLIMHEYGTAPGLPVEINPSKYGEKGEKSVPLNIAEADQTDRHVRKYSVDDISGEKKLPPDIKYSTDNMVNTDGFRNISGSVSGAVADKQMVFGSPANANSELFQLASAMPGDKSERQHFIQKASDLKPPIPPEKSIAKDTFSELDMKLLQSAAVKNRQRPDPAKNPDFFPAGNATNQSEISASEQINTMVANIGVTSLAPSGIPTNSASTTQGLTAPPQTLDISNNEKWIAQISSEIRKFSSSGDTLRFQLKPVHLGQLQIEIGGDQAGKNVHVMTENEESRALIAAAQSRLEHDFRLAGSRLGRVDVTVEPDRFPDSPSGDARSYEQRSSQSNKNWNQTQEPENPQNMLQSNNFLQNQKQTNRYA